MRQFLKTTMTPATALFALGFVAFTSSATPASAGEYCRKDVTSATTSCSFDTLAQCQGMSSGRGGDCFRDPFLPSRDALAYAPKTHHAKPHHARPHAD
jgi:Protein of unknown function (DUF3551)